MWDSASCRSASADSWSSRMARARLLRCSRLASHMLTVRICSSVPAPHPLKRCYRLCSMLVLPALMRWSKSCSMRSSSTSASAFALAPRPRCAAVRPSLRRPVPRSRQPLDRLQLGWAPPAPRGGNCESTPGAVAEPPRSRSRHLERIPDRRVMRDRMLPILTRKLNWKPDIGKPCARYASHRSRTFEIVGDGHADEFVDDGVPKAHVLDILRVDV